MIRRISAAVLLHVMAAVATRVTGAQQPIPAHTPKDSAAPRYRFRILGAYDEATGEPIDGVTVRDVFSGLSAQTTATGTVSLFFLPDGGSLVRLTKIGYEMQTLPVAISPTDTAGLTVAMRTVVQLGTVIVRDSSPHYTSSVLRQAAERMHTGAGGYFIDGAQMRRWDNSTLANAIRTKMPGLMSVLGPNGETFFVSSRTPCLRALLGCGRPDCFIAVYVDGVLSTLRPDFSRTSTIDYEMAEFYPSGPSVPLEYPGPCGSLLLWTRER